jgi:HPt (histidine-containing phosphotransfer) domain-containing protein
MRGDFPDPSVVGRFARDFCASLDGKIDRLEARLQGGDLLGAADAVLSITTSSAMVGAVRLTQAALRIQHLVAAGSLEDAHHSLALLRACAAATVAEIGRALPDGDPTIEL